MSIKGSQILHDANGYVIDRVQTAGAGSLNIPEEKIYELGNFETVATVYDIPDLSFELESYDVSCEIEAIMLGQDPTATSDGDEFDFIRHIPIDVISPFKTRKGDFTITGGVIVPYLTLERATYRFGVRQNATQQFSLKGDSIYYTTGVPYYEDFAQGSTSGGAHTYSLSNGPAIKFNESGSDVYSYCVVAINETTGAYKRLFFAKDGTSQTGDYTNTTGGFTILAGTPGTDDATYSTIRVVYASNVAKSYLQNVHALTTGGTFPAVKPAAVRGKDIDVYIGDTATTPTFTRVKGVQTAEVTRSVSLQNDEELGNHHYVEMDYDVADVTGSLGIKPESSAYLFDLLQGLTAVPSNEVIGPLVTNPIPIEVRISHPDSGDVLKTIYVPDAKFQVPGLQGRANQKLEQTLSFTSNGGTMKVYQGERP